MEQEPANWAEVSRLFGPVVEADLRASNITLYKTLRGGLVVPKEHRFSLDEFQHLFRSKPSKKPAPRRNDKYKILEQQLLKCQPEAYDLDNEDNFDLFVNFRRTLDLPCDNVAVSSCAKSSESSDVAKTKVKSTSTRRERNELQPQIPDYINYCNYEKFESNLFVRDSNAANKFRELMGNHSMGYEPCLPLVAPIYDEFLIKHKRFGYKYILRNLPQDRTLMDGQISQRQLQAYFRKIFWVVVPVELFGNKKNVKKIRKMVNKYFQTAFGEYFSAQAVANHLNISTVVWLRVIEDEFSRKSILTKLVGAFFEKYIMAVLGTYIYTEKMTWSNEKVFFRLDYRKRCIKNYISHQIANGVYKEITKENLESMGPSDIPDARLTLHVKKNGIRPIVIIHPTQTQKKEASILNRLLYQMFLKKFHLVGPQKLEELWRNVHESCSGKAARPLFFVSCDIHDAFGSIELQKLLHIVLAMIDELDDKLTLQNFAIFNPRFSRTRYLQRELFDTPSLPLALPARTLSCRDTRKGSKVLDKEWLKSRMQSYILHRKVMINGKMYYQTRGIGQGVPLTSMLCEIYYGTMVLEEFKNFMSSGYLLRYVDDFLYFTQDKISAERYLERVHEGIVTYNCSFNPRKTSTNLPPYSSDEFVYLGYRFNINHLDVTPEFPDIAMRYTASLSWADPTNTLLVLSKRLANFQCLKVDKIVLDASINSKRAIERTIHQITIMSAKRCFAILLSMANWRDIPSKCVFNIIRSHSVDPLCRKISILCFSSSETRKKDVKSLRKSIWRMYSKTFQGNTDLFKLLRRLMKYRCR